MTPSHPTMQASENSVGGAWRHRTKRASHPPTMMIFNDGDSVAENIFPTTSSMAQNSAGPEKPAKPPPDAARITEISDEEVCPQCHCLLTRSEINQNKVGRTRRGRCTDCYLLAPPLSPRSVGERGPPVCCGDAVPIQGGPSAILQANPDRSTAVAETCNGLRERLCFPLFVLLSSVIFQVVFSCVINMG